MRTSIVTFSQIAPLVSHNLRQCRQRLNQCLARIDDQRIRSHFARAEFWLRTIDTCNWPEDRRAARLRNLDRLHDYWVRGIFPRNEKRAAWRVPVFIDTEGRACAVASLLIDSGETNLANRIAQTANYAAVKQMNFPELGEWVARSGFTLDELARVQCHYPWLEMLGILLVLTLIGTSILVFLTLTHNAIASDLNNLIVSCMAILMAVGVWPASIKAFIKTRHGMELFALPAVVSLFCFTPSVAILGLSLLSPSHFGYITALVCAFNIVMLPISWAGLFLTEVTRKKAPPKPRRTLREQTQ